MDIGEKQTNLLVKIGGVDVLNELVDNWYAKMAEEGLTIDPSLLDSIIELQKSTLENLLSGQDEDVGSTGLHTVHTTNGVNFSENEQKKATKLFRECVTSMGVAKAVEKEICAVCKATSWLNMENGGHSNFGNITVQMLKICKQNWKEYIAACGDEHVAGRLIMEGLYAFGAAYRSLHKLPPRTFSFRFVNQVDRFVRMAAPENEGMLRTELFQLSVKHVDFLTEKQFAEWSEVTLDSMIETIQAATDDTWGSTHQESWRVVLAWLNTVLWEQMCQNEPRVRRCIASWNIIADQHMNTQNDTDEAEETENALMAENTVGDEAAAKAKNIAAAARAAAKKKASNVDYLSETIMASRQVYIIVGQSFYFNATTMGVPIGEKAKRDIETVSELFGTFIGILLKFMCDPDAREEQSYLLSLRHLKYIELSDTEMIPALRPAFIVTLRSLLPRDWNKQYEESWAWLWDQTSAMFMGHCKSAWHARERIDNTMEVLRKLDIDGLCLKFSQRWINVEEITGFFDKPLGFQKIILLKLIGVVSTIYHEPGPAAEEIRGVGIRHVKYKVPEHLLPLLSNTVFQTFSVELPGFWNEDIEGAWRAPVGYFQKTMARAMRLGMNEVCRCCVAKDLEDLKAVLRMAPRGERNMWILETRAIGSTLSPFYWMLHENRTVLFSYMLEELYTIRADQENYYCGNDELFATHPGFVENLAIFLPGLFPVFFDHLVWISRNNENRMRRVNYYLKNVYGDPHQKRFFDPHNTPMATLLRLAKVDVFGTPVAQCLIRLKWESFGEWMYIEGILPYVAIFVLFMAGQVFTRHPNTHMPYTETSHIFCQVCMGIQFAIHLFLFFGTQCTTIWRERATNLVSNIDLVVTTIAVPSFFTRFSDVTRFVLNLGMIIGFITDEHMVHEFGDWIVDFDTTREVHSWGISVAVTLFTSASCTICSRWATAPCGSS
jgi:truncated hemoglobin YjbI